MTKQKFNSKAFAKAILDKRTKDNKTFRQIEKETKGLLKYSSMYVLEAEKSVPSAVMLADVCNWLQVPVSNFFN